MEVTCVLRAEHAPYLVDVEVGGVLAGGQDLPLNVRLHFVVVNVSVNVAGVDIDGRGDDLVTLQHLVLDGIRGDLVGPLDELRGKVGDLSGGEAGETDHDGLAAEVYLLLLCPFDDLAVGIGNRGRETARSLVVAAASRKAGHQHGKAKK